MLRKTLAVCALALLAMQAPVYASEPPPLASSMPSGDSQAPSPDGSGAPVAVKSGDGYVYIATRPADNGGSDDSYDGILWGIGFVVLLALLGKLGSWAAFNKDK